MSQFPFAKGREALYVHQEEDGAARGSRRGGTRDDGGGLSGQRHSPSSQGCHPAARVDGACVQPCATPNRTHGPPLAFPSCNPPVQSSTAITVGTPDANGAAANSVGFVKLEVFVGVPGPPDDSDVLITANITDVRCKAGTTACGAQTPRTVPTTPASLQGNATIRITDHFNAVAAGGGTDPATVVDIPYPINAACAATASTAIGGTCSANTSANAAVPGAVKDGKRANIEVGQIRHQ